MSIYSEFELRNLKQMNYTKQADKFTASCIYCTYVHVSVHTSIQIIIMTCYNLHNTFEEHGVVQYVMSFKSCIISAQNISTL